MHKGVSNVIETPLSFPIIDNVFIYVIRSYFLCQLRP